MQGISSGAVAGAPCPGLGSCLPPVPTQNWSKSTKSGPGGAGGARSSTCTTARASACSTRTHLTVSRAHSMSDCPAGPVKCQHAPMRGVPFSHAP